MNQGSPVLSLIIPAPLSGMRERIIDDFRQEGLHVTVDATGEGHAAGPPPDVNFVADLVKYALEHPIEHLIDVLWGAIGTGLALGTRRVAARTISRIHLHLTLPTSKGSRDYAVPQPPDDLVALESIKTHYERTRDDAAAAYIWKEGEWRESIPRQDRKH